MNLSHSYAELKTQHFFWLTFYKPKYKFVMSELAEDEIKELEAKTAARSAKEAEEKAKEESEKAE